MSSESSKDKRRRMGREGVLLLQEGMFLGAGGALPSALKSSRRAGPCGLGTQQVPNACLCGMALF